MSNENSRNVFPSEYCCHLIDFAKLAKIHKFRFANSWFDSPMATWRTLTGTLTARVCVLAVESEEDKLKTRNKERAVIEFFGAIREEGMTMA